MGLDVGCTNTFLFENTKTCTVITTRFLQLKVCHKCFLSLAFICLGDTHCCSLQVWAGHVPVLFDKASCSAIGWRLAYVSTPWASDNVKPVINDINYGLLYTLLGMSKKDKPMLVEFYPAVPLWSSWNGVSGVFGVRQRPEPTARISVCVLSRRWIRTILSSFIRGHIYPCHYVHGPFSL